jgi:hypothetical protein
MEIRVTGPHKIDGKIQYTDEIYYVIDTHTHTNLAYVMLTRNPEDPYDVTLLPQAAGTPGYRDPNPKETNAYIYAVDAHRVKHHGCPTLLKPEVGEVTVERVQEALKACGGVDPGAASWARDRLYGGLWVTGYWPDNVFRLTVAHDGRPTSQVHASIHMGGMVADAHASNIETAVVGALTAFARETVKAAEKVKRMALAAHWLGLDCTKYVGDADRPHAEPSP